MTAIDREALNLLRAGLSVHETARALRVSELSVRRALARVVEVPGPGRSLLEVCRELAGA